MVADLEVTCQPAGTGFACEVRVGSDRGATRHRVAVSTQVLERLSPGAGDAEALVRASFEYLLEREPRESILRRFDLPEIERYFPGYEETIRRRLERPPARDVPT